MQSQACTTRLRQIESACNARDAISHDNRVTATRVEDIILLPVWIHPRGRVEQPGGGVFAIADESTLGPERIRQRPSTIDLRCVPPHGSVKRRKK